MSEEFGEAILQSVSSLSAAFSPDSAAVLSSSSSLSAATALDSSAVFSASSSLSAEAVTITPQWWEVPSVNRMDVVNDDAFPTEWRTWPADRLTSTVLSWATMGQLNKEIPASVPATVPTDGYLSVRMSEGCVFQGYLLDLASGSAPTVEVSFDAYASFSMTEGQWLLLETTATLTSVADYRTPHSISPALEGVTAIRFKFTGGASISSLHIYGTRTDYEQEFFDPGGTRRLTPIQADFGMGGRKGSKDVTFRVHNSESAEVSPVLTFSASTDVSTGPSLLSQLWMSKDGVTFTKTSTLTLDPIPPGGLSPIVYVRRIAPDLHQSGTPWTVVAEVAGSNPAGNDYFYFFVGDVDFTKGQPQLWNLSVPSASAGDTVTVVAAGAGDTQEEFSSAVMIRQAPQDPIPLTVATWTPVADAVTPAVIDPSVPQYDAAHSLISVTVPEGLVGPCTIAIRCGLEVTRPGA